MSRPTFNALAITSPKLQKQYIQAFTHVLKRGIFLHGPQNKKLTKLLSQKIGTHVTLVASGHDALLLSIQSLHLKNTDEIIVPANAYPTAFAAALSGTKLVLADVDQNGQLSVHTVAAAITKNTKAVIMVHLYGATGDIDAVRHFCKKKHITLIEDCAQAFGTTYKHKNVGTFGALGCFSFYPTKNIGSFGDGGAICSPYASKITELRIRSFYGEKTRYKSTFIAGHSNLPELQAAGVQVALKNSQKNFANRKQIAIWYKNSLKHLLEFLQPLASDPSSDAVPHLFVILAKHRRQLQQFLTKRGIPTHVHYPTPIHRVRAFSYLGYTSGSFPIAESLAKKILSLPFHPSMTKSDVQSVARAITNFYTQSDTMR